MRITTLSPWIVGVVETRKSISLPRTASLMRPSCGSRRSAMLSLAMILMREMIALRSRAGGAVHLAQHAVDAKAQAKPALGRFEVDVRCVHLDRTGQQPR